MKDIEEKRLIFEMIDKKVFENTIDLIEGKPYKIDKKITFLNLIKKFYGKKIRTLIFLIRSFFEKK